MLRNTDLRLLDGTVILLWGSTFMVGPITLVPLEASSNVHLLMLL